MGFALFFALGLSLRLYPPGILFEETDGFLEGFLVGFAECAFEGCRLFERVLVEPFEDLGKEPFARRLDEEPDGRFPFEEVDARPVNFVFRFAMEDSPTGGLFWLHGNCRHGV